jgi:hypothetical protein
MIVTAGPGDTGPSPSPASHTSHGPGITSQRRRWVDSDVTSRRHGSTQASRAGVTGRCHGPVPRAGIMDRRHSHGHGPASWAGRHGLLDEPASRVRPRLRHRRRHRPRPGSAGPDDSASTAPVLASAPWCARARRHCAKRGGPPRARIRPRARDRPGSERPILRLPPPLAPPSRAASAAFGLSRAVTVFL